MGGGGGEWVSFFCEQIFVLFLYVRASYMVAEISKLCNFILCLKCYLDVRTSTEFKERGRAEGENERERERGGGGGIERERNGGGG